MPSVLLFLSSYRFHVLQERLEAANGLKKQILAEAQEYVRSGNGRICVEL